jgi:hypothetical protein
MEPFMLLKVDKSMKDIGLQANSMEMELKPIMMLQDMKDNMFKEIDKEKVHFFIKMEVNMLEDG